MLQVSISKIPNEGLDIDEVVNGEVLAIDPEELSTDKEGRFKAHVERSDDLSLHVRGHLSLKTSGPCARCLADTPLNLDQELDLFFLPESKLRSEHDDEEGAELQDRDLVVTFYQGDILDLAGVVREQILLAQPMKRLCREDCKGVCPTCGADRNLTHCGCPKEAISTTPFSPLSLPGSPERAPSKNAR
ncbi:MAG TPA: DUF177 domain-containing protein [Vicinamibacteria bacterium]|nr:DUF177 domain-containing protein [Vicinamibacteria bacterium]